MDSESGRVQIHGVAFGGTNPVAKVEVSTDGGRTWKPIEGPGFHTFSFAKPTSLPRRSGGAAAAGWGAGERGTVAKFIW
jgi:hypothetical protein